MVEKEGIFIQSFMPHGLKFYDPTKKINEATPIDPMALLFEVPPKFAEKPIVEITQEQYDKIKDDPTFKLFLGSKNDGFRLITHLPHKYMPTADLVALSKGEAQQNLNRAVEAEERNKELEKEVARLKRDVIASRS